ncbi:MAG TPA: thiamine ABC transporter substrate-binding protein [Thermoplasmata archaeon]|nr:thiamine ABC transporter substrate-binding protein [Thermoplasmata archaeon]
MKADPATTLPLRPLRRPGRLGRALGAVALATVLVFAGVGIYGYVNASLGGTTLVIYTYPSLLGGVNCGSPAFQTAFGQFASAHDVRIDVECPAGTLVNTLLEQSNAPAADLVIGLDEITTPEAEAHHLLVPYAPPELADIPPPLIPELSPDYAAVPYEYGYLAIDYSSAFYNATDGAVATATLPDLVSNSSWADQLVVEDPTVDITGEEFLVWEIEYYENVLHQDWTSFWTDAPAGLPHLAPDWGTAFGLFPDPYQLVVSYSTDPAYAAYYGEAGAFNSTGSWWNGTQYGWQTIYGIGIVNGTRHLGLDQEFENWFLSGTVQSELPTTEWEYPANQTVALPPSFASAIAPGSIVALNDKTTPAAVAASLPGWIDTWISLA